MTTERDHSYIRKYISNYIHHGRFINDFLIFFSLFLLSVFLLLYLFTWVHELSHFIAASIYRIAVTDVRVFWPFNGYVLIDFGTPILTNDQVQSFRLATIAGSMGGFFVALILNRMIYFNRNKRFSIFIPLFGFTGYWMVIHELIYWIKGIDYWIRGVDVANDAVVLLDHTPYINPYLLMVFFIVICCIIFSWLAINCLAVIRRKIETIKEKAEEWNRNNQVDLVE